MIELLRGSFGDDQPRFTVLVNQPVTPDQIDKIAELLNKVAEEGRIQVADQLTDQAQELNMGYENNTVANGEMMCGFCNVRGHASSECPEL